MVGQRAIDIIDQLYPGDALEIALLLLQWRAVHQGLQVYSLQLCTSPTAGRVLGELEQLLSDDNVNAQERQMWNATVR